MKVGDYVRTKGGSIGKIEKISDFGNIVTETFVTSQDRIIKSSPDIIDLIEVGDVVIIKTKYCEGDIYKVIDKSKSVVSLDCFQDGIMNVDNDDIKSIVTKEQFESMEYKL